MSKTRRCRPVRSAIAALTAVIGIAASLGTLAAATPSPQQENLMTTSEQTLSRKRQTIAPIAAATAVGDMPQLNAALNEGLDPGLTVSDAKEILVQMYAYTGFPRSLNAL